MGKTHLTRREFLNGLAATAAAAAGAGLRFSWAAEAQAASAAPGATPVPPPVAGPGVVQSFPALAADGKGQTWLACIERVAGGRRVAIDRLERNGARAPFCQFEAAELTGLAPPAVGALESGCVVAFPVEKDDRWRIACAFLDASSPRPGTFRVIDCGGSANINPAAASTPRDPSHGWVAWESNADGYRAIYAARVGPDGAEPPQRLSAEGFNSYNPAIVALKDGSLFVAWDSIRGADSEIYGAWRDELGRWQPERRITTQARIARHPALAAFEKEIWLAFQAQTYPGRTLNKLTEQRIVVARIGTGELTTAPGLFEKVSDQESMLVRPRIAFDPDGRLWLTARQSIKPTGGWRAMAWCCRENGWSEPHTLLQQQGRWQPAPIVFAAGGAATVAVQKDNLPSTWNQQGIWPDWESQVVLVGLPTDSPALPANRPLEKLRMPETRFSLKQKIELCAADLPRQKIEHAGAALTLFFGDLHDHTDLSVCARRLNPPGHDLFANLRDIEKLDFAALTDHGYNFDPPQWQFNGEQTRNNHDPGRFVTFLAEEWTSSKNPPAKAGDPNRYGHHNFIFLDPHFGRFFDSYDGDISPADVWKQLKGVEFICIPHELADWEKLGKGNPPTDWNFVDEHLQPVAEIFQVRQSYEYLGCPRQSPHGTPFKGYYLQDAWAKGIVIGVIASPDHGGGFGKAGVWATDLTREAIFAAIRARHTFGTSGAKMSLLLTSGDAIMGDKVARPKGAGARKFRVRALATSDVAELTIFRNNEPVHRAAPGAKQIDVEWTDPTPPENEKLLWYYARIQCADEELAWTSPIWFTRE